MKINFIRKNIVNLFNMKNRLLSIITLVSLTSGIVMIGGCTREEIDVANNFANEQNQNSGQEVQEPDVVVDPEVEPEVEPEIEPEVAPEEINPRDMKQVYGLDYDVPIYTDEEVAEARGNLLNNYKDYTTEEGLTIEQREQMLKDYYVANQDTIYQINDMFANFDIEKCIKSFKGEQPEAIYYDENNDLYVVLNNSQDKLYVYGRNFNFTKSISEMKDLNIGNSTNNKYSVYEIMVSPDSIIDADVKYSKCCYDDYAELYLNGTKKRDYNELKGFGLKERIFDNPIITAYDNEQQLKKGARHPQRIVK